MNLVIGFVVKLNKVSQMSDKNLVGGYFDQRIGGYHNQATLLISGKRRARETT